MSPCDQCHAGCCRSFAVPVTGADIFRIQANTHLGFWDFVCRWADPDGSIALQHAPQFRFSDEPDTPFVIGLLTDDSQTVPGTGKCRFLAETKATPDKPFGTASCSIHTSRPGACRAFPAKMTPEGDLAILYDIPASGRPGSHPVYSLCPRPWTPADIDPITQVQDLVVATYEMKFFHHLAGIWNDQPGPWELFPDFLEIVYSNRVRPANEALSQIEAASGPEIEARVA